MCIIALHDTKDTQRIPQKILRRCMETYPDGMGIMFPHTTKRQLVTWRTLDDFRGLWNRYTTARDHGVRVALHFRKTTAGDTNIDNCHPFKIGPSGTFGFMHNGTLTRLSKHLPDGVSDTRYFRDEILNALPGDFLKRSALREMLESLLDRDRALFMDLHGNRTIINESVGFWWPSTTNKQVWFSHVRDRRYLIEGKSYTPTVAGRGSRYCYTCQAYADHRGSVCPNRDGGSRDARDGEPQCAICEEYHPRKACPKTSNDDGRCVFCNAFTPHYDLSLCREWKGRVCDVCQMAIGDTKRIRDGYVSHLECELIICDDCNKPIRFHQERMSLGTRNYHTFHGYDDKKGSDKGKDEKNESSQSSESDTIEVVDSDKEFDRYIQRHRESRAVFESDGDVDKRRVELPDGNIRSVQRVCYSSQSVGSDAAVFAYGEAVCMACWQQMEYSPGMTWEIPLPQKSDVQCVVCLDTIHEAGDEV